MKFLSAEVLLLIITVVEGVQIHPSSPEQNICQVSETYYERTQVKRMKPKEVKRKYRCWSITQLFSCEDTIVIWVEDLDYKMVPKTKIVNQCCDGYKNKNKIGRLECLPYCRQGCFLGKCVAPDICACHPGFYGHSCERACPEGSWGIKCVNKCECSNGGKCEKTLGCVCKAGWIGVRCQFPCQDGYYGNLCKNKCNCNNDPCNHITGECIVTTSATTEMLSTVPSVNISFSHYTEETLLTSKSGYESSELSTTANKISETDIFKIPIYGDPGISSETEMSTPLVETTTETGAKEVTISEVELFENPDTGMEENPYEVSVKSSLAVTKTEAFGDGTTTMKGENEQVETETKINLVQNEVQDNLEGTINANTETSSSTILPRTTNEANIKKNRTNWIIYAASKARGDTNETDNFIIDDKGNSKQETIFKFLYFLPSLSVLSAVSFLILIIAARWIFVSHKKKTRMLVVVADKGSTFRPEEQVKFQAENFLCVNNCKPIFMSDVELDNTIPVLRTFKPVDNGISQKGTTIL